MKIVENDPLNTVVLEKMFSDPEDLHLVWPVAHWPFDHGQWEQVLDPAKGAISFLVYEGKPSSGTRPWTGQKTPTRGWSGSSTSLRSIGARERGNG